MIQAQVIFTCLNRFNWPIVSLMTIAAICCLGPVNSLGPNVASPRAQVPKDLFQLDRWLAQREAKVAHLRELTAKEVVWANKKPQQTPWSVVYIHGFSASKLETAPLTLQVAQALGANVFYTRLDGHGQGSSELGQATPQNWFADINEAIEIGKLLGQKVVVISCSTGSTLATWFALSERAKDVFAHVFISPNFGPKDKRAEMINWPWGHQLAFAIEGPNRGELSRDNRQNIGWTMVYPTQALFPMMALTKQVRESDLSTFKQPVLIFYSQSDQVVDPELIKSSFEAMGSSRKKLVKVDYSQSENQHVLAGDIFDPNAVPPMVHEIVSWLNP